MYVYIYIYIYIYIYNVRDIDLGFFVYRFLNLAGCRILQVLNYYSRSSNYFELLWPCHIFLIIEEIHVHWKKSNDKEKIEVNIEHSPTFHRLVKL